MNPQFDRYASKGVDAMNQCIRLREKGKFRRAKYWARASNRYLAKSIRSLTFNEQLALAA